MKVFNQFKYVACTVALAFSATLFTGCADLNPVDYSEMNSELFPKVESDYVTLVNECYRSIRSSWFDGLFATDDRGCVAINDATTEILTARSYIFKKQHDLDWNSTDDYLVGFYYTEKDPSGGGYRDGFANDISRCTSNLAYIEKSTTLTDAAKKKMAAEVRCARAFVAYTLYDMFGPLIIAPADLLDNPRNDKPLPRMKREEMVKYIEDDLLFAAENLPSPNDVEYGRFSTGLAKMLLIRLYLHETRIDKSYYTKVETLAKELMQASNGYQLQPSYIKMFELGGQGKANKEIIFALPVNTEMVSWNDWHMFVLPADFASNGMKGGYHSLTSTWHFYDSFEPTDTRRTYLLAEYRSSKTGMVVHRGDYPNLDIGPIPMKYGFDTELFKNSGRSSIDPIVYRYADVYLSLAEALYRKPGASAADKQSALTYINVIRERAGIPALAYTEIDSDAKFVDVILKERMHEFWCENGQYRADLIRMDKFVESAKTINGSAYATKAKEVYPLPKSVITDGKGVVIQNEGYD
uniref:RagB/SusD family nutrient uptake outer membrane protein n=1 Tax=Prevotella sp. GTC17260 TaxID=3236796 RepID=A0AB33J5A2_9BACT